MGSQLRKGGIGVTSGGIEKPPLSVATGMPRVRAASVAVGA